MIVEQITNKLKVENEKNLNDEWFTPEYAILPLREFVKLNSVIWCPFDKQESNYVKLLECWGHNVIYSHIDNGEDFFEYEPNIDYDYIISNPPYSLKNKVFDRLFRLKKPFAMLVGVVGIFESKYRYEMFKQNDFEIMFFDKRISFYRNLNDKQKTNPPFSSVYITHNMLHNRIVFKEIHK
jgi:hypothetical protein